MSLALQGGHEYFDSKSAFTTGTQLLVRTGAC